MEHAGYFLVRIIELVIAFSAVALTVVGLLLKNRERLMKTLEEQHRQAMTAVAETKRESELKDDKVRRETGESIASVRQQLTDIGYFIRDNYVLREDFHVSVDQIKATVGITGDKLEARCERIEANLHKIEIEIRNGRNRA